MFRITFAESPGFAADFAATDPMLADFGEVTLVPYGELYPGPYEVTPGDGAQTHLTKSGSTLSLKFNNNHKFKSGGTYTIQVYELDDTFFS